MISAPQFHKLFPSCPQAKATLYLPLLVAAMREAGIVTRKRAAAFCAQLGHESADFHFMEEIASGADYEGRKDLGNTRPEAIAAARAHGTTPGRFYKGHGPIQTTGYDNHKEAGEALSIDAVNNPRLLATPEYGFRAAAYFWTKKKLNRIADALNGRGDYRDLVQFDKSSRVVNGGNNGRLERERRYIVALDVLTDAQFADASLTHTLDVLTTPATPAATQPAPTPEAPTQPQPQAPATPAAAPAPSLLDEIPVTEETKAAAMPLLKRVGLRAGGALVTLWTCGVVGKLLLALAVVIVVGLVVYYRRDVRELAVRVLRKLKGSQ